MGVIDSGWDACQGDHRVEQGVGVVGDDDQFAVKWSLDDRDRNGHGTACAGIVLATAPEARIVPIRVFGARLETSPNVLVAAIKWATAQRLPLVNVSLGTRRPDAIGALYRVCARALQQGTIIVAAASNSGNGWSYPAVFAPVIGVGAASLSDLQSITYTDDSMFECGARAIGRIARGLEGSQVTVSGTSFATPVVTGHIARFLAARGTADINAIRRHLASIAVPAAGV